MNDRLHGESDIVRQWIGETRHNRNLIDKINRAIIILIALRSPVEHRLQLRVLAKEIMNLFPMPALDCDLDVEQVDGKLKLRLLSAPKPSFSHLEEQRSEREALLLARLSEIEERVRAICEPYGIDLDAPLSSLPQDIKEKVDKAIADRRQALALIRERRQELQTAISDTEKLIIANKNAELAERIKPVDNYCALQEELLKVMEEIELAMFVGPYEGENNGEKA